MSERKNTLTIVWNKIHHRKTTLGPVPWWDEGSFPSPNVALIWRGLPVQSQELRESGQKIPLRGPSIPPSLSFHVIWTAVDYDSIGAGEREK